MSFEVTTRGAVTVPTYGTWSTARSSSTAERFEDANPGGSAATSSRASVVPRRRRTPPAGRRTALRPGGDPAVAHQSSLRCAGPRAACAEEASIVTITVNRAAARDVARQPSTWEYLGDQRGAAATSARPACCSAPQPRGALGRPASRSSRRAADRGRADRDSARELARPSCAATRWSSAVHGRCRCPATRSPRPPSAPGLPRMINVVHGPGATTVLALPSTWHQRRSLVHGLQEVSG